MVILCTQCTHLNRILPEARRLTSKQMMVNFPHIININEGLHVKRLQFQLQYIESQLLLIFQNEQ